MGNAPLVLTDRIGDALAGRVGNAKSRLTLAAPFIKRKALDRLLVGLGGSVTLTILTRWSADEIAAGVSDLSVFDLVRDRGGARLLLHQRLHAKVFLIDDAAAVGSANVTDAALGFGDRPNAEAVTLLDPAPNRVFLFLARLERESVAATDELRRRFEEATRQVAPTPTPPVVEIAGGSPPGPHPFPRFRSPERLYAAYRSILAVSDPDIREAVLSDLTMLDLPEGLDEATFRVRVGTALVTDPGIAAFDRFVVQPRYFGEMAEWLRTSGSFTDRGSDDHKAHLQVLVRWLRHFLPGRYRLEEPNYSELFGRVDGWG